MKSPNLLRVLLFGAVVAGIGSIVTLTRERESRPRYVPVKPPDKRSLMPDFSWPSTAGHTWKLADHRGTIVLVNFWATWCAPCREETPDLVRVYDKYRGRGVTIAGVSMDNEPLKVVPRFAARYRVEYPILIPRPESHITDAIESLPTSFLLDREGRIARTWVGLLRESELTRNVEELLAERAAPAPGS